MELLFRRHEGGAVHFSNNDENLSGKLRNLRYAWLLILESVFGPVAGGGRFGFAAEWVDGWGLEQRNDILIAVEGF